MEAKKMEPIIDLIWSVEEDSEIISDAVDINANCGGVGIGCCCSVPNMFTKFLCT